MESSQRVSADDFNCLLGMVAVRGPGRALFRREVGARLRGAQRPTNVLAHALREPALASAAARARSVAEGREGRRIQQALNTLGIGVRALGGEGYPVWLAQIPDPPLALFGRGQLTDPVRRVAVIGSRRCSAASARLAAGLAEQLARHGLCVVSGLAEGVDGSAHRGALTGGGATLAVLGHGLEHCYPAWHRGLAEQIVATGGCLLSEYPPHWGPRAHQFPERNRIISGLVEAVLVVEASGRSGSLITARLALEQGRDVLAVPGSIQTGVHQGCHRLLKDGAALVETAEDVLAALGMVMQPQLEAQDKEAGLSSSERRLLELVTADTRTVDALAEALVEPVPAVLSRLCDLELKGFVQAFDGGYIRRPF